MSSAISRRLFFLLFALGLSAPPVFCASDGTETELSEALARTENWKKLTDSLQSATESGNARKFRLMEMNPNGLGGTPLPATIESFQNARFLRALQPPPAKKADGSRLVRDVAFGYTAKDGFRRIGTLSYLRLDRDGRVLEVGCATRELEEEFKLHVNRRVFTPAELDKIAEINRGLFDHLRADPQARKHVEEFARKREWPPGLADKLQLAFFSADLTSLEAWAKKHGHTLADLRDANWMDLVFDRYGRPIYTPTHSNSIKIPFFGDSAEERIVRFRTRLLYQTDPKVSEKGKGKYKTPVLNRTLDADPFAGQRVYNSWHLPAAAGKPLLITEGEFKAAIAREMAKLNTVGITGITDYDSAILDQLVRARASEIVILFDHDPLTSSNQALRDGITNTQRAAYQLARALERAGARNVRIGILPDLGKKVGLDDLLLEKGPVEGPKILRRLVDDSLGSREYARKIGLNEQTEELLIRRQALAQAIKAYGASPKPAKPGSPEQENLPKSLAEAQSALERLDPVYHRTTATGSDDAGATALLEAAHSPRAPPQEGSPPIHSTKPAEWQIALRAKVDSTLRVSLHPTIFGRGRDPLADTLHRLPEEFPEMGVGNFSRGVNLAALDLPSLSLDEARKLSRVLENLSPEELTTADLLKPVRILDPREARVISRVRDGISRIGLEPHREFLEWRGRLTHTLARHETELGPALAAKIRNQGTPLLELVDWAGPDGKALPASRVEEARERLAKLYTRSIASSEQGERPLVFDLREQPLDLAARDANAHRAVQFSFRADSRGQLEAAPVSRWTSVQLNGRGRPYQQTVEFHTRPFLAGEADPTVPRSVDPNEQWKIVLTSNSRMDFEDYKKSLSPELRDLVTNEEAAIPGSSRPSILRGEEGTGIYHRVKTQASFAPEKAVSLSPLIEKISLPSREGLVGGFAVYGSTTHREMNYPADSDLLYNSLIRVPPEIGSAEEAKAYARKVYVKEILGHFADLARRRQVAISEVRIGSDRTMNLPSGATSPADDFKSHPYLTQEQFLAGTFKDSTGKLWTLEELAALEDFTKIKFDYYEKVGGKTVTHKVSLQFLPAYEWHGGIHFMRSGALKGFPNSPVSTAAYFGPDSYGVAMLLERAMGRSASQYGPVEVLSVRELLAKGWKHHDAPAGYLSSDPELSTKFLKEYHRKVTFYQSKDPAYEAAIYEDTKRFMQRLGTWDASITFENVSNAILRTVNSPEINALNKLKGIVNDLEEFNGRNQRLRLRFWLDRKKELLGEPPGSPGLFAQIREAIAQGRVKPGPEFLAALDEVETLVRTAARPGTSIAAVNRTLIETGLPAAGKENGAAMTRLERAITALQHEMHTRPTYANALPKPLADYIRTSTALSPHIDSRFVRSRFHLSDPDLGLRYRLLGINPTPENMARMKQIDALLDTAPPETIRDLQDDILKGPPSGATSDCRRRFALLAR